jgi:hypothetical protein
MPKLIRNKRGLKIHHIGTLKADTPLRNVEIVSSSEYLIIKAWRTLYWFAYGLFGITVCLLSAIAFEPIVRWLLEGLVSFSLLLATHENATVGMP